MMRESIAWRRQRLIAEGLLGDKQRRVLADIRARRFIDDVIPDVMVPVERSQSERDTPTPSADTNEDDDLWLKEYSEGQKQWADELVVRFAAFGNTELKIKYDPDQPRDESGKWTSGGGVSGGLGGGLESISGGIGWGTGAPRIDFAGGTPKAGKAVQNAIDSLPRSHAEALKNVPVTVVAVTQQIPAGGAVGLYSYSSKRPGPGRIYIAEAATIEQKQPDGSIRRGVARLKDLEQTTLHEFGHAFDHLHKFKLSDGLRRETVLGENRMTPKERENALYFTQTKEEMFAELYSLAFNRKVGQTYFGSMNKLRATQVFAEALREIKRIPAKAFEQIKYYGEKPGERDEAGRFSSTGGGGAGGIESIGSGVGGGVDGQPPKTVASGRTGFKKVDFDKAGVKVETDFEETFYQQWNQNVRMNPADFRDMFMNDALKKNSTMKINFIHEMSFSDAKKDKMYMDVSGRMKDDEGNNIGSYQSYMDFKNKEAEIGLVNFKDAAQGKGYAKSFIAGQIDTFQKIGGLDKVELLAGLEMGGYAWAKYGFQTKGWQDWPDLQVEMEKRIPDLVRQGKIPQNEEAVIRELVANRASKTLWVVADKSYGKELLKGTEWNGVLNLRDSKTMIRFNAYVGSKGGVTRKSMVELSRERALAWFAKLNPGPYNRDEDGKFAEEGAGGSVSGLSLKPSKQRAWSGKTNEGATRLNKQEAGALGEQIAQEYLRSLGGEFNDARPINTAQSNFPIDLIGDHQLIEVKTGQVTTGLKSAKWGATIGEPGKEEKKWLAKASKEAKARHNEKKYQAILDRKDAVIKEYAEKLNIPFKGKTLTTIIDPDRKVADVFVFDGFHKRIGYNSPEAQKAYVGSFGYASA